MSKIRKTYLQDKNLLSLLENLLSYRKKSKVIFMSVFCSFCCIDTLFRLK